MRESTVLLLFEGEILSQHCHNTSVADNTGTGCAMVVEAYFDI